VGYQGNNVIITQNVSENTARAEKLDQLNCFDGSKASPPSLGRLTFMSKSMGNHFAVVQTTEQLWTFAVCHVHRRDKGSAAAFFRTDLHPVASPILSRNNIEIGGVGHREND